jgi:hypothetical protein
MTRFLLELGVCLTLVGCVGLFCLLVGLWMEGRG